MKTLPCSSYRYIILFKDRYALYNAFYPLTTRECPRMFGMTMPLQ